MRRLAFVVLVLFCALPVLGAEDEIRLQGIAYTEGATDEIQIQVWALDEQVAEHPEWQFEAVFGGVVTAGKAFSVDLGEAKLPVLVELTAEGHGAISLEVVFPEQLKLQPAWLRQGKTLKISVVSGVKSSENAVLWGEISADSFSDDPRRWQTAVAHRSVAQGTSFDVVVPSGATSGIVYGVHPQGHFGTKQFRMAAQRSVVRLELNTVEVPIKVWDHRGRPVAGVRVTEATSPFETADSTDEEGCANLHIPLDGQWKIVALDADHLGTVIGQGRSDGVLALDLETRTDLTATWEETAGPMVVVPSWIPRSLGGSARVEKGLQAKFPRLEKSGFLEYWSPTAAYGYQSFEDGMETIALKPKAAVSINGRIVTADGSSGPGLPVWIRLDRRALFRYRYMFGARGAGQPLSRPWLPWSVSNVDGRFSVAGLPPSDIQAETLAPGLPTARGERLVGKEGDLLETTIVLRQGSVVGLRVTDPEGDPIDNVTVDLYRSDKMKPSAGGAITAARTRSRGDPELTGSTDEEGRAVLQQVPVGLLRLRLSRSGFVTRTLDGIDVSAEGADLGDLVLAPGVTLRGTTIGPDSQAVGNAEVAIHTDARMPYFRAETTSAEDGSFSIPDLAMPGTIYLQARAEGLVPAAPLPVEMPPEGDIEVLMASERKLEGVVLDARDDAPVTGADLRASVHRTGDIGSPMGLRMSGVGHTTSDSSGKFQFDGLAGGTNVEISITADGLRMTLREVAIPVDTDPESLIVRLEPGLELRGRVISANGDAAPGLRVWAGPASQSFEMRSYSATPGTTTDVDGAFVFNDLAPGKVSVQAISEDGLRVREVVEAGQNEEVVLRFEPGLPIAGVVLNPESTPVAGAFVAAHGECAQNGARYETAADGRFELTGVKPGTCRFWARAEGYAIDDREVEIPEGGLTNLEIRLERGATVVGELRGLTTTELEGCFIHSDDGASTEAGIDGSFRLTGVGSGERQITAQLSGSGRKRSVSSRVPEAGESSPVIIDFESGFSLSGRVMRGGSGASEMIVVVAGVGSTFTGRAISGSEGDWRIDGLEVGEYQIAVQSRSGEVVGGEHVLLETDTELDIQIADGRISGHVIEAGANRPIEGAKVLISGSGLPPVERRLTTDSSGYFEASSLSEADYFVKAEAPDKSPVQRIVAVRDGVVAEITLSLEPERTTVLVVRSPGGGFPSRIGITTATGGVVGPLLQVTCAAGGRCEIDELAPGRWTLAVGGDGAALVVVDLPQEEVAINLRRAGRLIIRASDGEGGAAWQARLIEVGTGIVMPLNPWYNPGRGEWVPVGASGLTVSLPEGEWRIETFAPDGTQGVQQATVTGGGTTEVTLE